MGGTHLTPPNILHNQWKIVDNCTKHALHMQTAHPNSRERQVRTRYRTWGRYLPVADVEVLFLLCDGQVGLVSEANIGWGNAWTSALNDFATLAALS